MNESRETTIILAVILLVLVGSLVGIGLTIYSIVQNSEGLFDTQRTSRVPSVFQNPNVGSTTNTPTPTSIIDEEYDFPIGQEGGYKLFTDTLSYDFISFPSRPIPKPIELDEEYFDQGIYDDLNKQFLEPDDTLTTNFSSIEIPILKMRSDVMQGEDSVKSMFTGWWLVPSKNNLNDSEKIILCQRRLFMLIDPRACQYMNLVQTGDDIVVYAANGDLLLYEVISKDIVREDVETILRPSSDNYLRIVTSSDKDGDVLGEDYRVVILAKKVN